MPIKINGTNTAANPSITGSDTDTGIVYGSDQIDFSTGGSSKVTLAGSDLGIGTTSPDRTIHCHNSSNTTNVRAKFSNGTTGEGASDGFEIGINASDPPQAVLVNYEASPMAFFTNATERMRIDSEGRVAISSTGTYYDTNTMLEVVGKTGAGPNLILHRNDTTVSTNQVLAALRVTGNDNDGSTQQEAAAIEFAADGNHANNDKPGRIVFKTTADGGSSSSERMRIDSSGNVLIGTTSMGNDYAYFEAADDNRRVLHIGTNSTTTKNVVIFRNPNNDVGRIQTTGSTCSYLATSDYRLKENVIAISDGITRLKTLKPSRFNFKVNKDTTVDGFLAHEVTAVPEAISGEKDAVKEDGSIDPQGIDQSKLVPLLTAALQEAVGKIEVLETKVAALEAA